MPRFHKSEIARLQLQTAVGIFLSGLDRSSVITLAGAASGLLDSLVKKAGKEPFVDYAIRVHCAIAGNTPKRQSYSHHIDKRLGVIAHKHLGKNDPETIDLDLEKMAIDALCRAITDYTMLKGQDEPFVKSFLGWAWKNMDGAALMESYKAVPAKLKPKK
jgi:hypothetical protein